MSVQAMSWVLDHSQAELGPRLVLLSIANHANKLGRNAFPNIDTIAEEARVDRATVYRAIAKLVALGELEMGHDEKHQRVYSIPPMSHPATNEEGSESHPATQTGGAVSHVATASRRNVPSDRRNVRKDPLLKNLNRPEPSRAPAREAPAEDPRVLTPEERERNKQQLARLRETIRS